VVVECASLLLVPLGCMNASYRFLTYGAVPIGALLTVPWVLARPLPGLRRMPAQPAPR
jgi:hypothetical protein